jgi:hypothetical protein
MGARLRAIVVVIGGLVLLAHGCSRGAGEACGEGSACTADSDCLFGTCASGHCTDTSCGSGLECVNGTCGPPLPTQGQACTLAVGCNGFCCDPTSLTCVNDPPCLQDSDCSNSLRCLPQQTYLGVRNFCACSCTDDSHCAYGTHCSGFLCH